uniref:Uncharacterized protein n=1 Tax=Globisporangium ultimum (strain ATCC 200006 / CBS 805.95 / DAOM BR144) TaxID=431595 RepID=K3WHT7_GLOUD
MSAISTRLLVWLDKCDCLRQIRKDSWLVWSLYRAYWSQVAFSSTQFVNKESRAFLGRWKGEGSTSLYILYGTLILSA